MSEPTITNDYEVYSASVRDEMAEFVPAAAKTILDVGCSVGNFGEFIKTRREVEFWGIEADARAAKIAAGKLDHVICGLFDRNLNLPAEKFDCIVFNDVLEHMIDPYSALVYAKELLTDGGKVVASIPNFRYFSNMWALIVHKNWEYVDTGILDRTHLRFFTIKSIASTFTNLGYEIETLQGIHPLEECEPNFMRKFNFLNFITGKRFEDMRWLQFAVVARPQKNL